MYLSGKYEDRHGNESSNGRRLDHTDGIKGFGKRVLCYFQDFIETDFRRQQAPRRRVTLKNDAGFRTGISLRKYSTLFESTWKTSREPLSQPFEIRIPKGRYTSPLSLTLRDLIKKQVAAVEDKEFTRISDLIIEFANSHRVACAMDTAKFVDDTAMHFVENVGAAHHHPLTIISALLDD